jgi:hypothetical protein
MIQEDKTMSVAGSQTNCPVSLAATIDIPAMVSHERHACCFHLPLHSL